jgi:hypothetical protein
VESNKKKQIRTIWRQKDKDISRASAEKVLRVMLPLTCFHYDTDVQKSKAKNPRNSGYTRSKRTWYGRGSGPLVDSSDSGIDLLKLAVIEGNPYIRKKKNNSHMGRDGSKSRGVKPSRKELVVVDRSGSLRWSGYSRWAFRTTPCVDV